MMGDGNPILKKGVDKTYLDEIGPAALHLQRSGRNSVRGRQIEKLWREEVW